MYNQQGYEKIKNLAQMNGVSVKKCQSAAVKRGLPFINEPATKQTKNTENSPVSTSVSPINTPIVSPAATPIVSPDVTPIVSPTVTPSISPAVTPIISPAVTPIVSPAITPVASPTPSRSSSVTMSSGSPKITEKVFKTANGVTFTSKMLFVSQIQKHTVTMLK
ncbi:protein psiD-like [Mytilus trossulus]|uniref:protein psiD-like n=1 Tax=Mytilus trossulus TaxID=6551 RepID=UPI0030059A97